MLVDTQGAFPALQQACAAGGWPEGLRPEKEAGLAVGPGRGQRAWGPGGLLLVSRAERWQGRSQSRTRLRESQQATGISPVSPPLLLALGGSPTAHEPEAGTEGMVSGIHCAWVAETFLLNCGTSKGQEVVSQLC